MPTQNPRRRPSLAAEFGTPGDARAAMEALENHGIDGLEITVLDGPADDHRRPADRRALVHVSGRVAKGAVLGALVGAAVPRRVGVIVAVGAFWSVERGVSMSEDWEKTFQEPAAAAKPTRIGVYTRGDADTMLARRVLEDHRPLEIREESAGSGAR